MAIWGIGAFYENDVSREFIDNGIACIGHHIDDAPALHNLMQQIKTGDIIYLKAHPPSKGLIIKAIGIILDNSIRDIPNIGRICRNVRWVWVDEYTLGKIEEKYNVRNNTLYEEYNPSVQRKILDLLFSVLQ